jgi:hypothetical protein
MENSREVLQKDYSFALKRIQLLEKSLGIVAKRESDSNYDFDISSSISIDVEKHLSMHVFAVKVKFKPDNRELASVSIVCVFDIFNFNEVISTDSTNPSLPPDLLNLLNTVVIGTMRGVMFSEFRGTALDNLILPVLDPTKFKRTEI